MADIFLSYARTDKAQVASLVAALEARGWSVWWDPSISPGQEFDEVILKELGAARAVIVVWTPASVDSRWVRGEAREAADRHVLIPVRFDAARLPLDVRSLHTIDLDGWRADASSGPFQELSRALTTLLGAATEARVPAPAPGRVAGGVSRRRLLAVATLAMLLVAGVLAFLALRPTHQTPAPKTSSGEAVATQANPARTRIAVLPFEQLGQDPDLAQFAVGLVQAIIGRFSQGEVPVLAPRDSVRLRDQDLAAAAAQLHFGYAFDGTVERDGKDLLVRIHLDDAQQGVTVWSDEFRAGAGDADALQDQVAATAALVADVASGAASHLRGDTEAMNLAIKSALYSYRSRSDELQLWWDNQKRFADKFPQSAFAHSQLAIVSAFIAARAPAETAARMRDVAKQEIARTLQLDPHDFIAWWASANLFPNIGHWTEREAALLKGGNPGANFNSNFYLEVGRLQDALDWGRVSQAYLPHTPNRDATLLLALAAAGQMGEAIPLAESMARSWPAHPSAWNARLHTMIFARRWDDASALFKAGPNRPYEVDDTIAEAWRGALAAMQSGDAATRRAAARAMSHIVGPDYDLVASLPHELYDQGAAIAMMAVLGDKDGAFQAARSYLAPNSFADSTFLFWPDLADFRADPRFMQLAADIGLVDYWRSTGKWPDYCVAPNAPYDCKTEAARHLKPATGNDAASASTDNAG